MSAGPEDVELRAPVEDAADADVTEADVSEAELDPEKQPMTGTGTGTGTEDRASAAGGDEHKNGTVKLKIPEEEEVTFTGLSKEELLRVAGTPGWVRTRWALLLLFWVGWVGMLGGAVLLLLQAPPCRAPPPISWWSRGPLYRLPGDLRAFTHTHNLRGVQQKMDALSQLKVKGVVIGPLHVAPPDDVMGLSFEEVAPDNGNLEQFRGVVQEAHRRGLSVVLDLTPNYLGTSGPWFSNSSLSSVAERLKSALVFWLDEGVDGVQLSGVEQVSAVAPPLWSDIRAIVQNQTEQRPNQRLLMGVSSLTSPDEVSSLLSSSGVDLLISGVLAPPAEPDGAERAAAAAQQLYSAHGLNNLAWSLGGGGAPGGGAPGHLASLVGGAQVRTHLLLLLTLPGTALVNYGDEIGLMDTDSKFPMMLWGADQLANDTQEAWAEHESCRRFFVGVASLRGAERSLLHGDFLLLSNSSSALSYLRTWDQSARFVAAFNWAEQEAELQLSHASLPPEAQVALSTDPGALPPDATVRLGRLRLGPGQGALLRFPYRA